MSEKSEKKVIEFAKKKMRLKELRAPPELRKKKSRWSPGLLKQVSEVEFRVEDKIMVVKIDDDTEEAIGWRYPDAAIGSRKVKIKEEEALQIAKEEVGEEMPEEAELDSVKLLRRGVVGSVYVVKWIHKVEGIPVEGDFLIVKINPETGEVTSVTKNWSEL